MNTYMNTLPQPVERAYDGASNVLNIDKLTTAINYANTNFNQLSNALSTMTLRAAELSALNTKLIQFMNWLSVTNPQTLDEFQTTATAFDKLVPRDGGAASE